MVGQARRFASSIPLSAPTQNFDLESFPNTLNEFDLHLKSRREIGPGEILFPFQLGALTQLKAMGLRIVSGAHVKDSRVKALPVFPGGLQRRDALQLCPEEDGQGCKASNLA